MSDGLSDESKRVLKELEAAGADGTSMGWARFSLQSQDHYRRKQEQAEKEFAARLEREVAKRCGVPLPDALGSMAEDRAQMAQGIAAWGLDADPKPYFGTDREAVATRFVTPPKPYTWRERLRRAWDSLRGAW